MAIQVKRGDTAPIVDVFLFDRNGNLVDLTGASARFIMSTKTTPRTVKLDVAAEIVDATGGQVQYPWQAGDTDTAGEFVGEIEVTYADGRVQTFPTKDFFAVTIFSDLGGLS